MFNLKGLLQAMGVSLLLTIIISLVIGMVNSLSITIAVVLMFIASYVSLGVLSPKWNRATPYFASFIGAITLSLINFWFASRFMGVEILTNPEAVNKSLVFSTLTSLITTYIVLQIQRKRNESVDA
ncbi:hypothetical protein [Falsibacillus albus]|uniref:Uncharacterized protein n=1 Tax=Falsibacillus albus TaxID=2478915 RepID=A0A3L7JK33_9BACI|nr:hypothetical protein [Falsibacillus albus]RLQ91158.1 hypothetical protein D9X91_20935 [Falsibacillus albus]